MKIAICEDDAGDLQRLKNLVDSFIAETDLAAELTCFQNGEELMRTVGEGYQPSICIFDIYMNGLSGVSAAREVKALFPQCAVIFVTSSPDHMADGFDIGAVHYLVKPVEKEKVAIALNRALKAVGDDSRYIELTVNRQTRKVMLADILYAETQAKYCNVYIKHSAEPLRVYIKLDDLFAQLSHRRFLRCHHSYIVNLDMVDRPTESGDFLLQNGASIPIRQRTRKEILTAYNDYYFEKMRKV